ncbi:MAG: transcriptional regulator [Pirellulaceae bacterium]|nr:transcriptional regulator [Planctomycetales bacterium]
MSVKKRASRELEEDQSGRFAYDGLDRVLHEKARLGIMTSLATSQEPLVFGDLKQLCSLTDGNLNRHLQVLTEIGYVAVVKQGQGRGSQTLCQITAKGRRAFAEYLHELERVMQDAASAVEDRSTHRAIEIRPSKS